MVIVCVWLWKLQLHGEITNGNNVTQNTKHTNLFNEKKITLYQHLSKRTRTNLQLGQFWRYINWFKIALQIKLQFYLSYGSFVVHLWPLDLSIKASARFFTTKVYVGIKNTLHWQDLMDGGHLTWKVPRWKLAKPRTHRPWRPTSSHDRHGTLLPMPLHETMSQNVARQDCVIKTKKYYNYYSSFYRLVVTCGDLCVFVLIELTYQHKTWCSPFWMPCRLHATNQA